MSWLKKVVENLVGPVEDVTTGHPARGTERAMTENHEPYAPEGVPETGLALSPAAPEPDPAPDGPPFARHDDHLSALLAEVREASAGDHARAEGIAADLRRVAERQDELQSLFESKIQADEVASKSLEKLHDQLRDYKLNFVREEMKPFLRDLTFCYDYADEEVSRARAGGPPPSPEEVARSFEHVRQMIADVLAKYDIEAFRSEGDGFDQKSQQCVRTVPTGVEADHKKVAAVGAVGFRSADLILRKEQVTVYKYTPGPAAEPTQGV